MTTPRRDPSQDWVGRRRAAAELAAHVHAVGDELESFVRTWSKDHVWGVKMVRRLQLIETRLQDVIARCDREIATQERLERERAKTEERDAAAE